MASGSICERAEGAVIVNELLEKKTALDVIALQTGYHRSSVYRHSKKCFPAWRAARLKTRLGKNGDTPGRLIVQWPDGAGCTYDGERILASAFRANDVLVCVEFEKLDVALMAKHNPRTIPATRENLEILFDLATAEDAQRNEPPSNQ